AEMLQRFGLANSREGITKHGIHEVEHPECGLAIGVNPVSQVIETLLLHHRLARWPRPWIQVVTPNSRRSAARSIGLVRPRRARASAASNRAALAGERSR